MWFNVKEARDFLLTNGFVYTLRPKKRREGREALMYEGFGKKGELQVRFVKEIESDEELETRVERSGFRSVEEWRKKAGDSRFLYLVGLVSLEPKPIKKLKPFGMVWWGDGGRCHVCGEIFTETGDFQSHPQLHPTEHAILQVAALKSQIGYYCGQLCDEGIDKEWKICAECAYSTVEATLQETIRKLEVEKDRSHGT